MSFTVVFEPDAELEIIEAFQWYEEQLRRAGETRAVMT